MSHNEPDWDQLVKDRNQCANVIAWYVLQGSPVPAIVVEDYRQADAAFRGAFAPAESATS